MPKKDFHILSERRQRYNNAAQESDEEEMRSVESIELNTERLLASDHQEFSNMNVGSDTDSCLSVDMETDDYFYSDWSDLDSDSIDEDELYYPWNHDLYENHEENAAIKDLNVENEDGEETLAKDLASWKIDFNIGSRATTSLLVLLGKHGINVPKDSRRLMKTPKNTNKLIVHVDQHKYIHFGIEAGIRIYLESCIEIPDHIELNVNLDGLPLTSSSKQKFWPIQCAVVEKKMKPFIVGVIWGCGKPSDANGILRYFVDEEILLEENGILFKEKRITVSINAMIFDAPAMAFAKCTKYHCGHYSCSRCDQKEKSILRRLVFPLENSNLRNDRTFRTKEQPKHHKGTSILERLNIDMVAQIPLDYMHVLCLGVVRLIIRLFVFGLIRVRIESPDVQLMSEILIRLKICIPHEFARKPRSFFDIKYWKATECRQFLLYTAMVVLKPFLSAERYQHFLTLMVASRILCDEEKCFVMNEFANDLLEYFVGHFDRHYGTERLTYNVHSLLHLATDSLHFGPLDSFSAFPFENAMKDIKKSVRMNATSLQQLFNRRTEANLLKSKLEPRTFPYVEYERNSVDKVKAVHFESFTLLVEEWNNTFQLKNESIAVANKFFMRNGSIYVKAQLFAKCDSFFHVPCDSKKLGIFVASKKDLSVESTVFSVELIKTKMVKLPYLESKRVNRLAAFTQFVFVPFLHHFE